MSLLLRSLPLLLGDHTGLARDGFFRIVTRYKTIRLTVLHGTMEATSAQVAVKQCHSTQAVYKMPNRFVAKMYIMAN